LEIFLLPQLGQERSLWTLKTGSGSPFATHSNAGIGCRQSELNGLETRRSN